MEGCARLILFLPLPRSANKKESVAGPLRTFNIFLTALCPPFSGHPRFVFPSRTLSSEPRGRRGGGRHSRDQDFRPIICARFGNMPTVNVLWCATPRKLLRGRLRTDNTPSSPTSLGKQKRNRRRSPSGLLKCCRTWRRALVVLCEAPRVRLRGN